MFLRGSATYKRMSIALPDLPHSISILLDVWAPQGLRNEQTPWAVSEWFNPFVRPTSQREWERIQRGRERERGRVMWFCQMLLWHLGQANALNGMQTDLLRAFREADYLSSDCHTLRAWLVIAKAFLNPLLPLATCQCNPWIQYVIFLLDLLEYTVYIYE